MLENKDLQLSKADRIRSLHQTGKFSNSQIAVLTSSTPRHVQYTIKRSKGKTSEASTREYLRSILAEMETLKSRIEALEASTRHLNSEHSQLAKTHSDKLS